MAEPSNLEKKGITVDEDARSTAEGQVYGSPDVHASLNSERRYGKCGRGPK